MKPCEVSPEATAVATVYYNETYIQDEVLPILKIKRQSFSYQDYIAVDKIQGSLKYTKKRTESSCLYDYEEKQVSDDCDLAYESLLLMEEILSRRETRCAELLFNPNSYNTSAVERLDKNERFDNYKSSDPVSKIKTAISKMIFPANTAIIGYTPWRFIKKHPRILNEYYSNVNEDTIISKEQFAELLGVNNVTVGNGWHNTSKKGNVPSMVRLWGNNISLIYQDKNVVENEGKTFGFTAQWRDPVAGISEGSNNRKFLRVVTYQKEIINLKHFGVLLYDTVC